ncbi:DUF1109 family protein [Rhizobium sp. P40RR-XXII]|uniref:NrsF family protein n=1 Tax=unclassified Rhizobium TaxID=2613769 RepID=UPI00145772F3|nr:MULTISPECIES: NrsF family protein [unclassified Rhizobium]NLR86291.1 DUF1109 family protein [Rhizobium sp. P28RR-XV]NLS18625.1 DUF1109 family protein [Rhizobium sp. P40RR-XXII]
MKTDNLIMLIAQDAQVRSNLDHMLQQAIIAAILIAAIGFFSAIGFRPDIDNAMGTGRFLFKFVITISLATSGGLVMFRIGKPGVPWQSVAWSLLVPLALAIGAAVFELSVMPPETWGIRMIGHNSRLCLTIIPLLSIGPLACFLLALRHGAPAKPAFAGAVAGLASAGIAATFYAANCNDDSPLFVLLWYPIAICVVTAAGALAGCRLLRW